MHNPSGVPSDKCESQNLAETCKSLEPATYSPQQAPKLYAAFFAALNFAQRAFCNKLIFLRADGDMVRLGFTEVVLLFALAHRAFCAKLIRLRAEADMVWCLGWVVLLELPVPFNDSIPAIIWSNFSISICAWLRFSRSSRSAFSRFDIVTPSGICCGLIV